MAWYSRSYPFIDNVRNDSRNLRRLAKYENQKQWQDVFSRNVCIVQNIFEWEGLPITVDQEFFETILLFIGQACVVKDPAYDAYIGVMTTPASNMNIYYQHSLYRAYSLSYNKRFMAITEHNKDIFNKLNQGNGSANIYGCVCEDNHQLYPLIETIEIYTTKIVNCMRALDVAQKQAVLPTIIETDEDTKLAIQQAIDDINNNVLVVYAGKNIAKQIKETKSFPTQFNPTVIDVLWQHYNNLYSSMLTAFGIDNLNTNDKKERLITDEIESNNEYIALNAQYRLDHRLRFCRSMKAAFGLDITCRIKDNIKEIARKEIEKNGINQSNTGRNTQSDGV